MVPGSGGRQPFSLLLFEYIVVVSILKGDAVGSAGRGFGSSRDYASSGRCLSGEELGFGCVDRAEYDGELVVGDPSASPVDLWLSRCKPGISQNDSTIP